MDGQGWLKTLLWAPLGTVGHGRPPYDTTHAHDIRRIENFGSFDGFDA